MTGLFAGRRWHFQVQLRILGDQSLEHGGRQYADEAVRNERLSAPAFTWSPRDGKGLLSCDDEKRWHSLTTCSFGMWSPSWPWSRKDSSPVRPAGCSCPRRR